MITYKTITEGINWNQVAEILNDAGLSPFDASLQEKIFCNSYSVVFAMNGVNVIGVARALSDGFYQAFINNVAVKKEFQGQGIGSAMLKILLNSVKGQNIALYTNGPGVSYYERFGFRRAKTAMCKFVGSNEHLQMLENEGFMLPQKYRFKDEVK